MNLVSASVDWLFCWHVWGSWYQWSAASFSTGCGDGDGYGIFIWHQVGVDMFRFMVSKLSECWAFWFWSSGDSWTGASGTQDSMVVEWGWSILDHTNSCCFGSGSSSKDPFSLFHDAMCSFAWPHSSNSLWICSWHLLSPCFERLLEGSCVFIHCKLMHSLEILCLFWGKRIPCFSFMLDYNHHCEMQTEHSLLLCLLHLLICMGLVTQDWVLLICV